MVSDTAVSEPKSPNGNQALTLSTVAFTACFAVWTIFSIIGVEIQRELALTEAQFGLLIGTPILTGSLIRLVVGIWAEQFGGRIVTGLVPGFDRAQLGTREAALWFQSFIREIFHV